MSYVKVHVTLCWCSRLYFVCFFPGFGDWCLESNIIMVNVLKGVLVEWYACTKPIIFYDYQTEINQANHMNHAENPACLLYCTSYDNQMFQEKVTGFISSFPTTWNSDPAMKQFLLYLDETSALGKKFIIQDLDDTHVFILAEVVHILQERVGELMDQNSFPITQK